MQNRNDKKTWIGLLSMYVIGHDSTLCGFFFFNYELFFFFVFRTLAALSRATYELTLYLRLISVSGEKYQKLLPAHLGLLFQIKNIQLSFSFFFFFLFLQWRFVRNSRFFIIFIFFLIGNRIRFFFLNRFFCAKQLNMRYLFFFLFSKYW